MNLLSDWLHAARPADVAVADDSGAVTYGTLLAQSENLARRCHNAFGTGTYVLLPATKSAEFVVQLVAVSRSGNIPVPVDPAAPTAALAGIAAVCGGAESLAGLPDTVAPSAVLPDRSPDTALVLFTSGTSGTPKGVPVSWSNLAHSVSTVARYLDYATHRSAAIVLPLHYSYALLTQLLAMFHVGGRSRLFATFRNPIKFAKTVVAEELASFCGVPSTYHALCAIHRLSPLAMGSIKVLCSAGAAMDRSLMPEIRSMFPNATFFDNYGMTEATPRIAYLRDDDPRFAEPTCGKAIDGLDVVVLDASTETPLPDGESGIVAIRGPNVFAGYLNDPASTERAFSKEGYLLSGDIGHLRDGYIFIEGRADDVFNVGGEKISPLEIEHALSTHPDVVASAVGRVSDAQRGTLAVAYIETDSDLARSELIDFLAARLPPAKIPHRFVRVSSWPLTGNGKLQRARLSPSDPAIVVGELT